MNLYLKKREVSKGEKKNYSCISFIYSGLKIMVLERNLYYNHKDLKKGKILPKHSNCGYILVTHNRGAVQKFMQIRSGFLQIKRIADFINIFAIYLCLGEDFLLFFK